MTLAEAEKRLALSEATVSKYEQMGGMTSGSVKDRMRMIFEETQILFGIGQEHPALAERAKAVGDRYGRLAMQVKGSVH